MMTTEVYLSRSRLFQRLKNGPHGQLIERYAARLVEDGLVRQGAWRCLNVVGGLLSWMASSCARLADLDECRIERYVRHRGSKQTIQPGDRAALRRWLSVLREASAIAPAPILKGTDICRVQRISAKGTRPVAEEHRSPPASSPPLPA